MEKDTYEFKLALFLIITVVGLFAYNLIDSLVRPAQEEDNPLIEELKIREEQSPTGAEPEKLTINDVEWRETLTPEQYRVMREGAMEAAFTGTYYNNEEPGIYYCAACKLPLFSSADQYDAKTGWPTFTKPIDPNNIILKDKVNWLGQKVIDVLCRRCESHLGDLSSDGPPPTGTSYSINSVALEFIPTDATSQTAETFETK
jgi:peptide-methionine (R)-S-oxide reductase